MAELTNFMLSWGATYILRCGLYSDTLDDHPELVDELVAIQQSSEPLSVMYVAPGVTVELIDDADGMRFLVTMGNDPQFTLEVPVKLAGEQPESIRLSTASVIRTDDWCTVNTMGTSLSAGKLTVSLDLSPVQPVWDAFGAWSKLYRRVRSFD